MDLYRIEELELSGKRALLRADLNVTFKPGTAKIADESRIRASLPTINLLRDGNAKTMVCSHLGRPEGRAVPELKIEAVRRRLAELLECEILFAGGPDGDHPAHIMDAMPGGGVAILENLRFHPGEETDDPDFATQLAGLADVFINDAFGASHRSHASVAGIPRLIGAYAGLLMRSEVAMLERALRSDEAPTVAIIGGSKAQDKLGVIQNLANSTDHILIGGGMVAAFQAAQGYPHGAATISEAELASAETLIKHPDIRCKLRLPQDIVTASQFSASSPHQNSDADSVSEDAYILDIGLETIRDYCGIIRRAGKLIWNGPMGVFEWQSFSGGTFAIAQAIAENSKAFSIAGGGSTIEAIQSLGLGGAFTHVSTGGGASLEYLEGKMLPGIQALKRRAYESVDAMTSRA